MMFIFGITQGSILGPLLFDIFICDVFMFLRRMVLLITLIIIPNNSLRIHHCNLKKCAIEILKIRLGLAPEIMKNVFPVI